MLFGIDFFLIKNTSKHKLKVMPPPGKIYLLACSSHSVSHDVIPWLCQGSLSIGWIWSLLSREGYLWVTVLSPKRFTPTTFLCCKGTHAGMIISSAAWMGNSFLSDGKCALSPLYFLFTVLASFGGLGGRGKWNLRIWWETNLSDNFSQTEWICLFANWFL